MKKNLITLLLVISTGIAFGQKDSVMNWGSGYTTRGNYITLGPSVDTIPCVMLYTDTTSYYFSEGVKIKFDPSWMYGYSVGNYFSIRHTYLDKYKKPLKKTIIVWQSISR